MPSRAKVACRNTGIAVDSDAWYSLLLSTVHPPPPHTHTVNKPSTDHHSVGIVKGCSMDQDERMKTKGSKQRISIIVLEKRIRTKGKDLQPRHVAAIGKADSFFLPAFK